jgi:Zn-dependent peptidase ImmA (M78 family)
MVYKARPISRSKIREFTNYLRVILKIDNITYIPVLKILEHTLPMIDENFNYDICSEEEMGKNHGLTIPEENLIKIREDIYHRARKGSGRDRFTIMHEIGHYLLHSQNRIALASNRDGVEIKTYEDPEWQASAFAGEFLMPKNICENMSVDEVVDKCGVSRRAAEVQLKKYKKNK